MNIVVAIFIFSIIVVIHELGHFLLAKKNGVGVTEFSVGMGPRLITVVKAEKGFSLKILTSQKDFENREDWQDRTKYSLKLLPIGGSCMMLGEDELLEDDSAFNKKGVWARISIIFAGPFFNFILAFVFSMIIISVNGYDTTKIPDVLKDYPMEKAGIQKGDFITEINGSKISIGRDVSAYLQFNPLSDKAVEFTYEREGVERTVSITPVKTDEGYKLGFTIPYTYEKASPLEVVKYSAIEVRFWITTTIKSIGGLITRKISPDGMAGPVGVVDMVGDVIQESKQFGLSTVMLSILNMCVLISANLGVMNLLPIPALDGGRLVFLFIEVFRGKPIDQDKEGMVHLIGLFALMLLMVFVMYNDISRLIK